MEDIVNFKLCNKVIYLTNKSSIKSNLYLQVRTKENRILTDIEVLKLPYLKRFEWPYREKSTERFIKYVKNKTNALNILDLGCGNGWFSNKIAQTSSKHKIIGLDINQPELDQAARVFKRQNLQFIFANIFECETVFKEKFDIISLNGSIQYFKDFNTIFLLLKTFLKPNGEIHIIDSPFYKTKDIAKAKLKTATYYTKLGVPKMACHYYHHDVKLISNFEILYQKKMFQLKRWFGYKDSPFSWYRYIKK